MRISDDRYTRERLSLDLALRFLRHEARTQTIGTVAIGNGRSAFAPPRLSNLDLITTFYIPATGCN